MRRLVASVAVVLGIAACSGAGSDLSEEAGESAVDEQAAVELREPAVEEQATEEATAAYEAEAPVVEDDSASHATAAGGDAPAPAPVPARTAAPPPPGGEVPELAVGWVTTEADPVSTFATDVDTGSWTLARRALDGGVLPDGAFVRTEEFVNAFEQEYAPPVGREFAIHVDGAPTPFAADVSHRLLRIGLQSPVPVEARRDAVLTLVVDVSGSMGEAGKLDVVRPALTTLVTHLRPTDSVALVVFSDSARTVLGPTPASQRDVLVTAINGLAAENSTNPEAGLRLGYELARQAQRPDANNRVVLVSDGVANVGLTDPEGLLAQLRDDADAGIQMVSVGVGFGVYNDPLMERLADGGDGFYAYVDGQDEAERLFATDLVSTLETVALDAKVQVELDPTVVRRYRLLGFDNRVVADEDFRDDTVDAGDIGAGHSVTALYEVELIDPAASRGLGVVRLRWQTPATGEPRELDAPIPAEALGASWQEANPRLQASAVAAAFAEQLSRSVNPPTGGMSSIAGEARRLSGVLSQDPTVADLARLTDRALALGA